MLPETNGKSSVSFFVVAFRFFSDNLSNHRIFAHEDHSLISKCNTDLLHLSGTNEVNGND